MNYEEFKKALIQKVTEGAGEDAEITVHRVPKNNGVVLDGLDDYEERTQYCTYDLSGFLL